MTRVRVVVHAKVNLSLEVLGRRPDGFHEIRTVMQSISVADELSVEQADALSLECDVASLEGEDNLVMRAARALLSKAEGPGARASCQPGPTARGARIALSKGIPIASGLGGASADTAAALVAMSNLWGLRFPAGELASTAAALGSDVPFFLIGGTALASGRGEEIEPLPDLPPTWLVLLVPPHTLAGKTAELYRQLKPEHWSSGQRTALLAEAIRQGERPNSGLLGNCFEAVADRVFPGLARHREAMLRAGAPTAHLSGAGPAIFSPLHSQDDANLVADRLLAMNHSPLLAKTLTMAEAGLLPEVVPCSP